MIFAALTQNHGDIRKSRQTTKITVKVTVIVRNAYKYFSSREHGLNSENVLSPSLDQRRGTHCPSV